LAGAWFFRLVRLLACASPRFGALRILRQRSVPYIGALPCSGFLLDFFPVLLFFPRPRPAAPRASAWSGVSLSFTRARFPIGGSVHHSSPELFADFSTGRPHPVCLPPRVATYSPTFVRFPLAAFRCLHPFLSLPALQLSFLLGARLFLSAASRPPRTAPSHPVDWVLLSLQLHSWRPCLAGSSLVSIRRHLSVSRAFHRSWAWAALRPASPGAPLPRLLPAALLCSLAWSGASAAACCRFCAHARLGGASHAARFPLAVFFFFFFFFFFFSAPSATALFVLSPAFSRASWPALFTASHNMFVASRTGRPGSVSGVFSWHLVRGFRKFSCSRLAVASVPGTFYGLLRRESHAFLRPPWVGSWTRPSVRILPATSTPPPTHRCLLHASPPFSPRLPTAPGDCRRGRPLRS